MVGVARDAKYASLDETTPPFFYVPLAQLADPKRALLVRGPAATAGPAIVEAVRAADPQAAGAAGRRVRRRSAGGAVPAARRGHRHGRASA